MKSWQAFFLTAADELFEPTPICEDLASDGATVSGPFFHFDKMQR